MNPLKGEAYYFWSGIGNDLPIYLIGILPMFYTWYHHHRCHIHGCWRLGHPDPMHNWPACHHHHSMANKIGSVTGKNN